MKAAKTALKNVTVTSTRGFEYHPKPCGACGAKVRRAFVMGKGNRAKRQRPKWYVCDRGHRLYRKAA